MASRVDRCQSGETVSHFAAGRSHSAWALRTLNPKPCKSFRKKLLPGPRFRGLEGFTLLGFGVGEAFCLGFYGLGFRVCRH